MTNQKYGGYTVEELRKLPMPIPHPPGDKCIICAAKELLDALEQSSERENAAFNEGVEAVASHLNDTPVHQWKISALKRQEARAVVKESLTTQGGQR